MMVGTFILDHDLVQPAQAEVDLTKRVGHWVVKELPLRPNGNVEEKVIIPCGWEPFGSTAHTYQQAHVLIRRYVP